MRGGFTGFGRADEVAGAVHKEELVVPADVLRGGIGDIMAFARQHTPDSILGNSGQAGSSLVIQVDARGSTDPAAVEAAARRGAQSALAEAGAQADIFMRSG
jgi:hypothetical protein